VGRDEGGGRVGGGQGEMGKGGAKVWDKDRKRGAWGWRRRWTCGVGGVLKVSSFKESLQRPGEEKSKIINLAGMKGWPTRYGGCDWIGF